MDVPGGVGTHRWVDAAVLRASAHVGDVVPAWWPDNDDVQGAGREERWCEWLAEAWARDGVAAAVTTASPTLAARISEVCGGARPGLVRVRRLALALARYLVRMRGRPTPFGLFAGVAPVRFGGAVEVRWSDRHRIRVRPDALWLAEVIDRVESGPDVLCRLAVVRNDLALVRGDRLVVPQGTSTMTATAEASVRLTAAVRVVRELPSVPIAVRTLVDKIVAEIPGDRVSAEEMVTTLVRCGALITCLRSAPTAVDPLGHLRDRLHAVGADLPPEVTAAQVERFAVRRLGESARVDLPAGVVARWAVDLGLDGAVVLPEVVAHEAATAADVLLRLSRVRHGHPGWRDYHARFLDRFGVNGVVAVEQLVDPITGLGLPEQFTSAGEPQPVTARDERLLQLAQQAAWAGSTEVVLDDALVESLDVTEGPMRHAPHLDVCAEVWARSRAAVNAGDFRLAVVGIGQTGFATSGRFLDLLPEHDEHRATNVLRELPTAVAGAVPAQLSFAPSPTRVGNVARVRRVLPTMLSVGQYRPSGDRLDLADLAVTADHQAMYLLSRSRGVVVEPVQVNAVARHAMPQLARFVAELPRAASSAVSLFDWGAAACLPFLPRLRYGRIVLAGARWRLDPAVLPGPDATRREWRAGLDAVRAQLRLPDVVAIGWGDRWLRLHLDAEMDTDLLRDYVDRANGPVTMAESPRPVDHGWLDGRAHEILIPLANTAAPAPAPAVVRQGPHAVLIGHDHGVSPGSRVLSASLACHLEVMDTILDRHLRELLDCWDDQPPRWWFLRIRTPCPRLRLRLHVERYGAAVEHLGGWARDLRRQGLVGDLALDTYRPEVARYTHTGDQPVMEAAEAVFAGDSVAARIQLIAANRTREPGGVRPLALVAASLFDLTCSLAGSRRAGAQWLVRRADLAGDVHSRDRALSDQVRALCQRSGSARTAVLGRDGAAVMQAWRERRHAIDRYRHALAGEGAGSAGIDGDQHVPRDSIVASLLHLHHVRALGPDPDREALCHRLARSAALAILARDLAPEGA